MFGTQFHVVELELEQHIGQFLFFLVNSNQFKNKKLVQFQVVELELEQKLTAKGYG